jgi:TRAP-type C4-dicarboxylate transport system permease large subunit
VAASGTLGILIPPSIARVSWLTRCRLVRTFSCAGIPGVALACSLTWCLWWRSSQCPDLVPHRAPPRS